MRVMEEIELQKKLEKFECQRCNECCRKPGFVYLKEGEAERIAHFLQLPEMDFVNQFCDLADRRWLVLKKFPDEACIFLTQAGCSIHPAKPQQCLDFPFKWRTPSSFIYCQGLKNLI